MRDGDLREQILGLEAQIEELAETIESCRKIIQISKAFIVVGGLLIAAITIGLIRFDPMLMIGALTAVVGGIVALGSNWSTSQQATKTLLNVSPRNIFLIWSMVSIGVTNRLQPMPPTVTALLP